MGSVHYTSPEQARGGYSDEKSDIYSMGITLFEMLTGRVPFNGETTVAIAIKHIQEEMPSPREYVSEIPVSVEQIVLKATQKSPDRRYHTVVELIDDLKRALMSPDEDFVRIESPDESGATRAVTTQEREQIKKQAKKTEPAEQEIRLKKNSEVKKTGQNTSKKKRTAVYDEPEEAEYDDNSRMERLTTLLAIIGAVLIGCAVIFLVGKTVGIFDFSVRSEKVTMIDVTGMSENEAVVKLKELGLRPEVVYEVSETVETGKVISSDIKSNTPLNEGAKVILTVSTDQAGQKGIPVPYVLGVTEAEAVAALQQGGFTVEKLEAFSDSVEKGRVVSQNPEGNSKAAFNTSVQIVISSGPEDNKILMPDILGMEPDAAVSVLIEKGLSLGQQSDMNDADPNRIGKVCYASYTAGMPLDPGTVVDIGISVGPKAVTYAFTDHITSPVDLDSSYKEGTECIVIITGQSGAEFYRTTVNAFPITTMNLHGLSDPAALITYQFVTEENATTVTGANGEIINIPGNRVTKTVQRQVLFTPEEG